jgi:UDP-N-acetylglucosamine transferase subunit ALG13
VIFLTVGTILPFDRLIRAVDDWARASGRGAEVFGQLCELGPDNYRPSHFEWAERLTPMDFRGRIEAADVIVAHAGIGTIVDGLTRGKRLLIMPRRHALREHVNDHQLETVRKFDGRAGLRIAMEPGEVGPALDALLAEGGEAPRLGPDADDRLIAAVRGAIFGAG